VFGRVALVRDAASTPRPHIGFGVSKAGAEAQALAEALSNHDDIDRALAAYNAARQRLSPPCSLASVSRPMKIAGWQHYYYKRPRALWIETQFVAESRFFAPYTARLKYHQKQPSKNNNSDH